MNHSRILAATLLLAAATTAPQALAQRLVPPSSIGSQNTIVLPVQSDQAFRVNELEEEVRRLNGRVEELNFLLLQMQEKLRTMEEDIEQRFQELEDKRSDAGSEDATRDTAEAQQSGADDGLEKPEASASERETDAAPETPAIADGGATTPPAGNLEPRALGTLTFDKDGNVVGAEPGGESGEEETETAVDAAEFGTTPDEVFAAGTAAMAAREWERAAQIFASHGTAWPNDPRAGEALFRLGEARFWRRNYFTAADAHLKAHKEHPEAPTAADNLLALGLALAGLNQREVACATYAEVLSQYPDAEARLGARVRDEQAAARC